MTEPDFTPSKGRAGNSRDGAKSTVMIRPVGDRNGERPQGAKRFRFTAAFPALVLLSALSAPAGAAAETDKGPDTLSEATTRMFNQLPEQLESWKPDGMKGAIAMQMFPFAGREDLVMRLKPEAYQRKTCTALSAEPVQRLTEAARQAQIVIINEAHDQPLHRLVIERLGRALADDIEFFAAETFAHNELAIRQAGRIPTSLGYYSSEPIFGRQLRALDAQGYRFVAYEARPHQDPPEGTDRAGRVIAREEAQAENLIAEVLTDDPDARILVHVGYSHALEAPVQNFGREIEWFAARLKRKTGIDPLTISQTHCSLKDDDPANALDALRLVDGREVVESSGAIDHFIAHPQMRFENGRPAWRRAIGDVEVPVPERFQPDDQRVLIEARAPDQPADEVPVERLLLYPGESLPLLLPPGIWRLSGWTADGRLGDPIDIEVSD